MEDAGCMVVRSTDKKADMRTRIRPLMTSHYFRHTYVTNLYKAGADAFVAMKVVGHADYQTTANIYTHPDDEMVRKTGVRPDEVFERKDGMVTERMIVCQGEPSRMPHEHYWRRFSVDDTISKKYNISSEWRDNNDDRSCT